MYSQSQIADIVSLLDRIGDAETKQAFLHFVTEFAARADLVAMPGDHGFIKDFRVLKSGRNCFAFIANSSWLLCYFRRPALSDGMFSEREIRDLFPEAEETSVGEFKLKVADYDTARRVSGYVVRSLKV